MSSAPPGIHPVYAVYGDESFLKQQAVDGIVRAVVGAEPGSMGPSRFDGDEVKPADVLDELRTLGLLGDRRLVIVDPADGFITKHRKVLEDYCAAPSEHGCLVLVCRSLPKNTRLHKAIAAGGRVVECTAPRPYQVGAWIVQRARETYGKAVDRAAAEHLRDLIGTDLGMLNNELGKLSVYVRDRKQIVPADVEALVGRHREETIFRVTDAMAAGDASVALAAWEQVLATDREAPARAIGGLAWSIRELLKAKQSVAAGASVHSLIPRFGRDPGEVARRLDRADAGRLQEQLCDLYEVDLATKTGLADVAPAVEAFIVKHTRLGVSKPPSRSLVGGAA